MEMTFRRVLNGFFFVAVYMTVFVILAIGHEIRFMGMNSEVSSWRNIFGLAFYCGGSGLLFLLILCLIIGPIQVWQGEYTPRELLRWLVIYFLWGSILTFIGWGLFPDQWIGEALSEFLTQPIPLLIFVTLVFLAGISMGYFLVSEQPTQSP